VLARNPDCTALPRAPRESIAGVWRGVSAVDALKILTCAGYTISNDGNQRPNRGGILFYTASHPTNGTRVHVLASGAAGKDRIVRIEYQASFPHRKGPQGADVEKQIKAAFGNFGPVHPQAIGHPGNGLAGLIAEDVSPDAIAGTPKWPARCYGTLYQFDRNNKSCGRSVAYWIQIPDRNGMVERYSVTIDDPRDTYAAVQTGIETGVAERGGAR
jgi:hypothetical protein